MSERGSSKAPNRANRAPKEGGARTDQQLERAARDALSRAYAPYSRFAVGAALVTVEGEIVTGCNIENAALPVGLCAERVALFSTLARNLTPGPRLVIMTASGEPTPPCGACREVLRELAPRTEVIAIGRDGRRRVWSPEELAPPPSHKSPPAPLQPATIIARKRDGRILGRNEIRALIQGLISGEIEDYQLTAFMMAVYWRGMNETEMRELTAAMLESGGRLDLRTAPSPRIDKHSTGGVGDKISLPLLPLAVSAGVRVPMISGRGLGHTGGTLDKLESIAGYRTLLPLSRLRELVFSPGGFIAGPTADLAPADSVLYPLRDVSATVGSVPLIVSSILSKKLAAGLTALVLDVKFGHGAFMPDRASAEKLARALVSVGGALGLPAVALLTRMDEPIGTTVGNALEVDESLEFLTTAAPQEDLADLVFGLGGLMLAVGGLADNMSAGAAALAARRQNGDARAVCRDWIAAQGGDARVVDDRELLQISPRTQIVTARSAGYVQAIDARLTGELCVDLGGGRRKAGEPIDHSVGVRFHCKRGGRVAAGDPLYTVHLPAGGGGEHLVQERMLVRIGPRKPAARPRIAALVSARGVYDDPWKVPLTGLV